MRRSSGRKMADLLEREPTRKGDIRKSELMLEGRRMKRKTTAFLSKKEEGYEIL
jgi:hypothetical protein